MVLILLEISEGNLNNAALQSIVRVLETGRSVDESLANTAKSVRFESRYFVVCIANSLSNVERVRGLDRVPILSREGINGLLLETLLAL